MGLLAAEEQEVIAAVFPRPNPRTTDRAVIRPAAPGVRAACGRLHPVRGEEEGGCFVVRAAKHRCSQSSSGAARFSEGTARREDCRRDFSAQTVTGVHAHRFVYFFPQRRGDGAATSASARDAIDCRTRRRLPRVGAHAQLTATFFLTRVNIQRETLSAVFTAKTVSASMHTLSGRDPRSY